MYWVLPVINWIPTDHVSSGNNLTGVAKQFTTQVRKKATQAPKCIAVFAMKNAIFYTKFFKIALFCYAKFWK